MEKSKQQYQQMEALLIKYLTGSATSEERDEAIAWINENSDHQKYFDELKDVYQLTKLTQKPSGFNIAEGWNRVKSGYHKELSKASPPPENVKPQKTINWFVLSASIAATAILAFAFGFYINKYHPGSTISHSVVYNEISVPMGAKSQVTLSDGTKVWLNAGTTLRYPAQFTEKTREVFLKGEAFFDVTKMKDKQFVVKTSHINIKVFGTQFNVSSYPEESQIQTTLTSGSVSIEDNKGNRKDDIFLKSNQMAIFFKPEINTLTEEKQKIKQNFTTEYRDYGDILLLYRIDPLTVTSWKDHRWVIAGEELGRLAVKLERRYNVKIFFENGSLKKYKFSGILSEETFEQVLKIIQLSAPVVYKIENNNVIFKEDLLYKKKYDSMISNPN